MMKKDKENWMEDVLGSLKGSKRAQPNPGLFARIESQIETPEAIVIPITQWRLAAAAAILLLMLNVFAIQKYIQTYNLKTNELVVDANADQQLISNYNPYE